MIDAEAGNAEFIFMVYILSVGSMMRVDLRKL